MGFLPIATVHLDGFLNDFSFLLAATLGVIAMFDFWVYIVDPTHSASQKYNDSPPLKLQIKHVTNSINERRVQ